MALVVKDRVKETTTTTGTGTVTLGGAVQGFQTFTSVLSNADTTYYAIIDYTNHAFEVGLGTFTSSGTTLARTTILESSNSGSAVDFGSGTKEVFITYPAEKSVYLDASNQLVINGTATTSTAAELSILDGDTSATSTTVADADRVVLNDNGTMKQVAVTDLSAYFDDEITAMPNLVTTAATTVGALNSGSITSGFGSINNGSSAITTTGTITYGSISDGSITVTAFVDEDNMSSNSATLIPTQQSVKAYVDSQVTAQDLDATTDSGTIDIDLDSETLTIAGGEGIDTSATGTTITITGEEATTSNKGVASFSSDDFSVSSGAVTIKSGGVTNTQLAGSIANSKLANSSITVSDGSNTTATALGGTITFSGTSNEVDVAESSGTITIGLPSNVTISGELDVTTLDVSGNADIDGTLEADAITIDGVTLAETISDTVGAMVSSNTETNITVTYDDSDNTLDFVIGTLNQDTTGNAATATALETARTIHGVSFNGTANIDLSEVIEDTVGAMFSSNTETNITATYQDGDGTIDLVIGTLNQDTTGTADNFTVSANNSADETVYPVFVDGATGSQGAETDTGLTYNPSSGLLTISGELDAGSLDISGNADINGTLEADAITVDGTALNEYIADTTGAMFSSNTETGVTVTYQDGDNTIDVAVDAAQTTITSLLATDIKIGEDDQTKIDFETADEIHFYAANAEQVYVADGIFGPQTDSDVDLGSSSVRWKDAYIDSVTTTGNVTVGGNLSVTGTTTTVNTVTMEATNAIVFEGATADAHETTLSIVDPTADHTQYLINQGGYIPVLAAATATAITSTPAELNILDGVTSTTAELNLLDGVTSTTTELNYNDTGQSVGTVVASKTVTVDSNKDVSSFRNVTLTGELDAATLDISGNADIAGDLTLSAGGDGALQFSAASSIKILDNSATALVVEESDNAYMTFITSNGSEAVKFDKALDLNAAVQLDSTLTIGTNDTGYDVKFFGGTSGAYLLWDEDVDDLILGGAARVVIPDGQLVLGSTAVTSTAAELNILDGVTTTTAEINLIDGGTSRGTTAVASGDGILINDAGTMRMTNVDTVSTYFASHSVGGGNIVTVGALNDGSITSGFGTIDTGSSTITTTGLISGGSLDIDNVLINGTTIGHTDDTDLITVADGLVTIAGEISTTTLDIGGTNVTSTAAELNILDGVTSTAAELNILDGVTSTAAELNILDGVTSTATELNIMDGDTSASSTTLVDADRVVANDNGTMKQVALTDIKTYLTTAGYASQDDATALAIALG